MPPIRTLVGIIADVIQGVGGPIGSVMFLLFAVASVPSTCFCAFIAGNSLNTMIPSVPRVASTMCGAAIGIILAVTGIAANLISFFTIIGASFGPICGAMAADYLLEGKRWSGPRQGVNMAGYGAWLVGFIVGILPVPADPGGHEAVHPARAAVQLHRRLRGVHDAGEGRPAAARRADAEGCVRLGPLSFSARLT